MAMLFALSIMVVPGAQEAPGSCVPPTVAELARIPAGANTMSDPRQWMTSKDYPPAALRQGKEGALEFSLEVDERGCPAKCLITRSSNITLLDEQTCALLMRRARFRPRTDDQGKPRRWKWSSHFLWTLPADPPLPLQAWNARATVTYRENGTISACENRGDSTRTHVGRFCDFAVRIYPPHLTILRGGRTGSFVVTMEGTARFDGQTATIPSQRGRLFSKVTLNFDISNRGDVEHCRAVDETPPTLVAPLSGLCGLLFDSYVPPVDARGKAVRGRGSIAIVYTVVE